MHGIDGPWRICEDSAGLVSTQGRDGQKNENLGCMADLRSHEDSDSDLEYGGRM